MALKERVIINPKTIHIIAYGSRSVEELSEAIARKEGDRFGLAFDPKGHAECAEFLKLRDPRAFRHILGSRVEGMSFEHALSAIANPAAYGGGRGFGFWWRAALPVSGYFYLQATKELSKVEST